jgi:polyhydroxyalkanoate synthesis regulator phasin
MPHFTMEPGELGDSLVPEVRALKARVDALERRLAALEQQQQKEKPRA